MKAEITTDYLQRTDSAGSPSIAPYIGGWNVWDIPPEEWTPAVQEAIKSAYQLGWMHCNQAHKAVEDCYI